MHKIRDTMHEYIIYEVQCFITNCARTLTICFKYVYIKKKI